MNNYEKLCKVKYESYYKTENPMSDEQLSEIKKKIDDIVEKWGWHYWMLTDGQKDTIYLIREIMRHRNEPKPFNEFLNDEWIYCPICKHDIRIVSKQPVRYACKQHDAEVPDAND